MKTIVKNEKGMTLVETLIVIVVFLILSVPMFIFMFDMINSAKQTEEEIFLRDEGDYVLGEFIHYIFAANEIMETGLPSDKGKKIEVHTFDQKKYIVGFENGNAVIKNGTGSSIINEKQYKVTNKSSIAIDSNHHLVNITLVMQSKKTGRELELKSSIGYLEKEKGEEG